MFESFEVPKELIPSDPRFGSGPSLIPVKFVQALADTGTSLLGTSHRKPAVKNLVKELQEGLRSYFNVPKDYEIVLGNGGATFMWDMIGTGIVEKSAVHYTCGEFSNKWFKVNKNIPWIEATDNHVDFGQGINPEAPSGFDTICCTLNETSTGVQIGGLPKVNDDQVLAIDATSGAGQIPCDVSQTDIFYFSPQKVFAGEGGLWVAIMSPKAIARARKIAEDKSRYKPIIMDWNLAIDNSVKNQTYNTPGVCGLFLMNETVKEMNGLGYERVCQEAKRKAELVYGWAESKDYLSPYIQDGQFRSQAVATIDVDDKFPVDGLIKKLRDSNIVYDIDAYRKLGRNQFRISLFHHVTYENLEKLTKLISLAMES
jgi:phosphoserine aminotransferase